MVRFLILYLPSLVGLVLVNYELMRIMRIAMSRESIATNFMIGIFFSITAVTVSWFVVFAIGYSLVTSGVPLLSWQVGWLPIGWTIATVLIFILITK
jgi:hypothetical protein